MYSAQRQAGSCRPATRRTNSIAQCHRAKARPGTAKEITTPGSSSGARSAAAAPCSGPATVAALGAAVTSSGVVGTVVSRAALGAAGPVVSRAARAADSRSRTVRHWARASHRSWVWGVAAEATIRTLEGGRAPAS